MEADYREQKATIRADKSLSWEKQERAIKVLGDAHYARRRQLEGPPPVYSETKKPNE